MQGSGVKTAEAYRPDGLAGLVPLSDSADSPPKKPRRKDTTGVKVQVSLPAAETVLPVLSVYTSWL